MDTKTTNVKSVQINRDNSGQIAVGEGLIVQIGSISGGVVNIMAPEEKPVIRPREAPVLIRPRMINNLLDRTHELGAAIDKMQEGTPVEIYSESGEGKTALLRALAYHPASDTFPDGIIYLFGRKQPVEDLMQNLYDAFFETSVPYKPGETKIRLALSNKRALILLDDLEMDSGQIQALMDVAPNCSFVLASQERHLWGEGYACALPGLPDDEADQLFCREISRAVTPAELPHVRQICGLLGGHPLHIIQAASLGRDHRQPLAQLAAYLAAGDPVDQLQRALLNHLNQDEKRVVAALAAMGGAPFPAGWLSQLTEIGHLRAVVQHLLHQGVVQAHGAQMILSQRLAETASHLWKLDSWKEWCLDQLIGILEKAAAPAAGDLSGAAGLIDPAMRMLEMAAGQNAWAQVVQLSRLVDPLLVMNKRWGAWQRMLHITLEASSAMEDLPARAWALHQLGTRALCLNQRAEARDLLVKALRLRHVLGDREGAAVTEHNLRFLLGYGSNDQDQRGGGSDGPGGDVPNIDWFAASISPFVSGVMVFAVFLTAALWVSLAYAWSSQSSIPVTGSQNQPGVTWTTLPPATATETSTLQPTLTVTPTSTATSTSTATFVPTATPTFAPTPTPCGAPSYWVRYVVQPGDTLYRLALNTGTSVTQIMLANCLDSTWILAGQWLWLPVLPPPTATIPVIPTPTTPYIPEVTITPSAIPTPELWPDLELNGVRYDAPLWVIRMTVIVRNRGTGPSDPGASGDVFYSYGSGESITSQQVEWSIREAVQPGGAAASRVVIQIYDPERYWEGTNVSTHAMIGTMGSTVVRVPLPKVSISPAQSDVPATPYTTPNPAQLIIPSGQ